MKKSKLIFGSLILAAAVGTGCGKSSESSGGAGSAVTIAGTLGTSSSLADFVSDDNFAADLSAYSVRCVTLTGDMKATAGDCSATGEFSLDLPGASGQPIGCFILKSNAIVATISFESDSTGFDGSTAASTASYTPGNSTSKLSLGAIVLDESKGKAVVKTKNISGDANDVSGTFADVTGTWDVKDCKRIKDDGTTVVCEDDKGPPPSIYLRQLEAKDAKQSVVRGLSVWESKAASVDCGEAEGVTLPQDWTGVTSGLTSSFSFAGLDISNAKVNWVDNNGRTVCGMTATAGTTTCASLANQSSSWGGMTPADCVAQCVANSVWDQNGVSGCKQDWNVNWSKVANNSGNLTCSSSGCGTGAAAGFVTGSGKPRERFVSGVMIVKGQSASLEDFHQRDEYPCISNGTNGCDQIHCVVNENVRLSILESDASNAVIEVKMKKSLAPNQPAACLTQGKGNYLANELRGEHFIFNAKKQ